MLADSYMACVGDSYSLSTGSKGGFPGLQVLGGSRLRFYYLTEEIQSQLFRDFLHIKDAESALKWLHHYGLPFSDPILYEDKERTPLEFTEWRTADGFLRFDPRLDLGSLLDFDLNQLLELACWVTWTKNLIRDLRDLNYERLYEQAYLFYPGYMWDATKEDLETSRTDAKAYFENASKNEESHHAELTFLPGNLPAGRIPLIRRDNQCLSTTDLKLPVLIPVGLDRLQSEKQETVLTAGYELVKRVIQFWTTDFQLSLELCITKEGAPGLKSTMPIHSPWQAIAYKLYQLATDNLADMNICPYCGIVYERSRIDKRHCGKPRCKKGLYRKRNRLKKEERNRQ